MSTKAKLHDTSWRAIPTKAPTVPPTAAAAVRASFASLGPSSSPPLACPPLVHATDCNHGQQLHELPVSAFPCTIGFAIPHHRTLTEMEPLHLQRKIPSILRFAQYQCSTILLAPLQYTSETKRQSSEENGGQRSGWNGPAELEVVRLRSSVPLNEPVKFRRRAAEVESPSYSCHKCR